MSVEAPPSKSSQVPPPFDPHPFRTRFKALIPLLIVAMVAGGGVALIAGTSSKQALPGGGKAIKSSTFAGPTFSRPILAPSLGSMHNYNGGPPVSVAADRGKAVFVTFLYTHCPDVCPLIASSLHTAMTELGPRAADVRLIAVSVDPHGDNPTDVAAFLHEHQLNGQMKYLLGTAAQDAPVWKSWYVGSSQDVSSPQFVNHTGVVYGIDASGHLMTAYQPNFAPSAIVHDVTPLLNS
ncbi:MAG TPA: SCO family protein [Solirubrobacteraceae bacterium]|nr:SCO family protein [Solirubrobacteraceae bacterium]